MKSYTKSELARAAGVSGWGKEHRRFAFGKQVAMTDDHVIVEATATSALPMKSRTS